MPSRYPAEVRRQVVELARSGTKIAQLGETFGMSEATIYNWLKQDRIDRGEAPGLSTEGQMELAAARRRTAPRQKQGCCGLTLYSQTLFTQIARVIDARLMPALAARAPQSTKKGPDYQGLSP
jgi:transposase